MKKPRLSVVEKIQAKQSKPELNTADISNVIVAARHGLRFLSGRDLVNVSLSIANIEALLMPQQPAPAEQPAPDQPKPAEAANG